MLGNYIRFNGYVFPNPTSCTMTSKTLENVSQSEAGTDLVCVVRSSKKNWTMSFQLSDTSKNVLEQLCKDESTQMYYQGTTYKVRIRDFSAVLVEGSEWLSRVNGLFNCSVKITEF